MRMGCVIASRIPAIALAKVWRAAKPTTRPSTADDASTPVAARLTLSNCIRPSARPITKMPTKTRRRSSRTRVSAATDSSRLASARSIKSATSMATTIVPTALISCRCAVQKPATTGRIATGMATKAKELRAVLIDCMGTLVRLIPPAPYLARRLGVDEATAERAFRAEVAYYLEHQLEASDTARLADLRTRCANVLADAAGVARDGASEALMASLRFEAFDDAAPALRELRERGLSVVVVSNWDCGLRDVLEDFGLLELVDAVVASAEVGASKPDARVFTAALAAAGCAPDEAVHVGDSVEAD